MRHQAGISDKKSPAVRLRDWSKEKNIIIKGEMTDEEKYF